MKILFFMFLFSTFHLAIDTRVLQKQRLGGNHPLNESRENDPLEIAALIQGMISFELLFLKKPEVNCQAKHQKEKHRK